MFQRTGGVGRRSGDGRARRRVAVINTFSTRFIVTPRFRNVLFRVFFSLPHPSWRRDVAVPDKTTTARALMAATGTWKLNDGRWLTRNGLRLSTTRSSAGRRSFYNVHSRSVHIRVRKTYAAGWWKTVRVFARTTAVRDRQISSCDTCASDGDRTGTGSTPRDPFLAANVVRFAISSARAEIQKKKTIIVRLRRNRRVRRKQNSEYQRHVDKNGRGLWRTYFGSKITRSMEKVRRT